MNLYGMVGNNAVGSWDYLGMILVAIDGTQMEEFLAEEPLARTGKKKSHVWRFYEDYNSGPKAYWDGVSGDSDITGLEAIGDHNGAHKWVCEQWCKKRKGPIDMVGFSRGGYTVMELARTLKTKGCACPPNGARFWALREVGMTDFADFR